MGTVNNYNSINMYPTSTIKKLAQSTSFKSLSDAQFRALPSNKAKFAYVKNYLKSLGCDEIRARLGATQVGLESGFGTSAMSRLDNNFMGMIGSSFKSLNHNLQKYKQWWIDPGYAKGNTLAQAARNIAKNGYCPEHDYPDRLISMDRENNHSTNMA
jgi:flagellum-specific peptidoglycan hydrolase FlgJ